MLARINSGSPSGFPSATGSDQTPLKPLRSLANTAKMNLHVNVPYGTNNHHIAEAVFKALARALRQAVEIDPRRANQVPSTKGSLDG